ncbi:unnamed protein product [Cyprideis torosa]|uniref:Uncharacterized protein n=1 Tax=Cyprideis torosa TaxID=163714 RepID=A0A7R8WFR7_9CRUS|nr:unnamed protein product [Cyprideis torosa]CAG0895701.1 unnamed protein product [Cyprideis torosa]
MHGDEVTAPRRVIIVRKEKNSALDDEANKSRTVVGVSAGSPKRKSWRIRTVSSPDNGMLTDLDSGSLDTILTEVEQEEQRKKEREKRRNKKKMVEEASVVNGSSGMPSRVVLNVDSRKKSSTAEGVVSFVRNVAPLSTATAGDDLDELSDALSLNSDDDEPQLFSGASIPLLRRIVIPTPPSSPQGGEDQSSCSRDPKSPKQPVSSKKSPRHSPPSSPTCRIDFQSASPSSRHTSPVVQFRNKPSSVDIEEELDVVELGPGQAALEVSSQEPDFVDDTAVERTIARSPSPDDKLIKGQVAETSAACILKPVKSPPSPGEKPVDPRRRPLVSQPKTSISGVVKEGSDGRRDNPLKKLSQKETEPTKGAVDGGRLIKVHSKLTQRKVSTPGSLTTKQKEVKCTQQTPSSSKLPKEMDCLAVRSECLPRAVVVRNLTRPFTLMQLKSLLREHGGALSEEEGDFWIDKVKSVCRVVYLEKESAAKACKSLTGLIWPCGNPRSLICEMAEARLKKRQGENKTLDVVPRQRPVPAEGSGRSPKRQVTPPPPQSVEVYEDRTGVRTAIYRYGSDHESSERIRDKRKEEPLPPRRQKSTDEGDRQKIPRLLDVDVSLSIRKGFRKIRRDRLRPPAAPEKPFSTSRNVDPPRIPSLLDSPSRIDGSAPLDPLQQLRQSRQLADEPPPKKRRIIRPGRTSVPENRLGVADELNRPPSPLLYQHPIQPPPSPPREIRITKRAVPEPPPEPPSAEKKGGIQLKQLTEEERRRIAQKRLRVMNTLFNKTTTLPCLYWMANPAYQSKIVATRAKLSAVEKKLALRRKKLIQGRPRANPAVGPAATGRPTATAPSVKKAKKLVNSKKVLKKADASTSHPTASGAQKLKVLKKKKKVVPAADSRPPQLPAAYAPKPTTKLKKASKKTVPQSLMSSVRPYSSTSTSSGATSSNSKRYSASRPRPSQSSASNCCSRPPNPAEGPIPPTFLSPWPTLLTRPPPPFLAYSPRHPHPLSPFRPAHRLPFNRRFPPSHLPPPVGFLHPAFHRPPPRSPRPVAWLRGASGECLRRAAHSQVNLSSPCAIPFRHRRLHHSTSIPLEKPYPSNRVYDPSPLPVPWIPQRLFRSDAPKARTEVLDVADDSSPTDPESGWPPHGSGSFLEDISDSEDEEKIEKWAVPGGVFLGAAETTSCLAYESRSSSSGRQLPDSDGGGTECAEGDEGNDHKVVFGRRHSNGLNQSASPREEIVMPQPRKQRNSEASEDGESRPQNPKKHAHSGRGMGRGGMRSRQERQCEKTEEKQEHAAEEEGAVNGSDADRAENNQETMDVEDDARDEEMDKEKEEEERKKAEGEKVKAQLEADQRNFDGNQNQRESIFRDIESLNLSKYISEAAQAVVEAKLKMSDIPLVIELCSYIHQRYADFSGHFFDAWQKALPFKKDDKVTNLAKLRVDLRLFAELVAVGIFPLKEGLSILGNCLLFLMNSDTTDHPNTSIVLSFCRHCGEDYAGLVPKRVRQLSEQFGKKIPSSDLIPTEKQIKLKNGLRDYYQMLSRQLLREHEDLHRFEKQSRRILTTRGDLPNDRQEKFASMTASYSKLLHSVQSLADVIDEEVPELPQAEGTSEPEEEDVLISFARLGIDSDGSLGIDSLWEDEETRAFYENLPDLRAIIPSILYKGTAPGGSGPSTEGEPVAKEEATPEGMEPATEDKYPTSPCLPEVAAVEGDEEMDGADEDADEEEPIPVELDDDAEDTSNPASRVLLTAYLNTLPNCVNRDLIDAHAQQFCLEFNTKANRKKLVKTLFSVPRSRLDLLPFYARLVAALAPLLPDIPQDLASLLKRDFRFQLRKKDQINIESKIKLIRFIGEMVKFGMFPKADALALFKQMLNSFTHHHIEMACHLLETCGRYLYRSPESHQRTKIYLDQMMRKKSVQIMDPRVANMVENAFYAVSPPDAPPRRIEELKPPEVLFLEHLVFEEMTKSNVEKIARTLRAWDWTNPGLRLSAVTLLGQPWRVKYLLIRSLAGLVSCLSHYRPKEATQVVDNMTELLWIALYEYDPRLNQKRITVARYLGELYSYRLTDHHTIFKVLYHMLTFGAGPDGAPLPSIDPPHDLVRVRLVATLLDTCGVFFKSGSAKKLDCFLLYYQRYFWYKRSDPMWEDVRFPFLVEHMVRDVFLSLRPGMKMAKSLGDACEAVAKMEDTLRKKLEKVAPPPAAKKVAKKGKEVHGGNLFSIDEEAAATEDGEERHPSGEGRPSRMGRNESGGGSGEEDGERPEDDDDFEGEPRTRSSSISEDLEGNLSQPLEDGGELELDPEEAESMESRCPEEEDFLASLDRLVADSIQERSREMIKPNQFEVPIPVHARTKNAAIPSGKIPSSLVSLREMTPSPDSPEEGGACGAGVDADAEEESVAPAVPFTILMKKGNKQTTKEILLPVDSVFAKNLSDKLENERREKQKIKQVTLDINDRIAEEEEQEWLAQSQRPLPSAHTQRRPHELRILPRSQEERNQRKIRTQPDPETKRELPRQVEEMMGNEKCCLLYHPLSGGGGTLW